MKKKLFAAIFVMGLLFLAAQPAFATIIDVNYYWYSTGGTWVDPAGIDPGYGIGNTSGTMLFKVEELWVSGDERANAALFPGVGMFKYDIHRLTYTGGEIDKIYDWKVYNPNHVPYLGTASTDGAATWTAAHTADYWYWSTTTVPINGTSGYFYLYTDAPRGIVTGDVSDLSGTFASGRVSGPVPEPASMALLGMGLVGLVGRKLRRKFMT